MATSTFDRPLVLTEKGVDNLIALVEKWEKNPAKPDGIKPYSQEEREEGRRLLRRCWFRSEAK